MVRTLSSALVAIVVSLAGLSAVRADVTAAQASDSRAINHENVLAFLKTLDPTVEFRQDAEGDYIYFVNVKYNGVLIGFQVELTRTGVYFARGLGKSVAEEQISEETLTKLSDLNRKLRVTEFRLIKVEQGRIQLAIVYRFNPSSMDQFRPAMDEFLADLLNTRSVWSPIIASWN